MALAQQPDGKIVVTGRSLSGAGWASFVLRYHESGALDTSFGGDGIVTTANSFATSIALQADGKIIVAGYSDPLGQAHAEAAVIRYNADGSLDSTFGGGDGKATFAIRGEEYLFGVAVQPDGKIVDVGATGQPRDIAVVRLNADGSLDNSFSGDGISTVDVDGGDDAAHAISLQPDGRIVVVGGAQVGSVYRFVLLRFNADGGLDTTFGGGDGIVTTAFGLQSSWAHAVALQPDGKIVIAGQSFNTSGNWDFGLARYNTDGTLDASFGTAGRITTHFGHGDDFAYGVAVQGDGKIVAAGSGSNGVTDEFAVARYAADGTLDSTFTGDGLLLVSVAEGHDVGLALIIQHDGRIVIAGDTSDVSTNLSDTVLIRVGAFGDTQNDPQVAPVPAAPPSGPPRRR